MQSSYFVHIPYRLLAVEPLFWPMYCLKRSRYSNRAVTTQIEQSYLVMCDPVLVIIIIIIGFDVIVLMYQNSVLVLISVSNK